jgi:hypothetical protein
MDKIITELNKMKNTLENLLGNVPDESRQWEALEQLLTQVETTIAEVENHER